MAEVNPKPGKVAERDGVPIGFRTFTPQELKEARSRAALTGANTHRATARGYAFDAEAKAGTLVEAGELVPANIPVSDEWMEKVKKGDQALMNAVEDAQQEIKDDPDYTVLSKSALEALATDAGVTNVKGLSKDDLITAIKAQADRTRTI